MTENTKAFGSGALIALGAFTATTVVSKVYNRIRYRKFYK